MKTRQVKASRLKPGMILLLETLPRDVCRDGNPQQFTIKNIRKGKGYFTGVNTWTLETEPAYGLTLMFHAAFRGLPEETAPVIS